MGRARSQSVARRPSSVNDPDAVKQAMAEYALDPAAFLERYKFDPPTRFALVAGGRRYPPKAIVAVAFAKQYKLPPLDASEFKGGPQSNRVLEKLKFKVVNFNEKEHVPRTRPSLRRRTSLGQPGGQIKIPSPANLPAGPPDYDPDTYGAGRVEHERTRLSLKKYLESRSQRWLRPASGEPDYDFAWKDRECFNVVEVKSVSGSNLAAQVRRGLGQVLEYRYRLSTMSRSKVEAVVALSVEPADATWVEICGASGVLLAWPPWTMLRTKTRRTRGARP